jgi:hypothetical protein
MPLVSRGVPAFASSGKASAANDSSYATEWVARGPSWLAYDLRGAGPLKEALVAWYNNETYGYDLSYGGTPDGIPSSYAIEVHPDTGSARPPSDGWIPRVTVAANRHSNRMHAVDLTGQRWIRLRGVPASAELKLNLDVHDARNGFTDTWIFVGDSNTALYMTHAPLGGRNFSERVHASAPARFPAYLNCGIPGLHAVGEGLPAVKRALADHPEARYVVVALGGNDSRGGLPRDNAFYRAYRSMVDAILAAGRIPVVPRTVIWHGQPAAHEAIGASNPHSLDDQLAQLHLDYRDLVVAGPDLWTFLENSTRNGAGQPLDASGRPLMEPDLVHVSNPWGIVTVRDLWSDAMISGVHEPGVPALPAP